MCGLYGYINVCVCIGKWFTSSSAVVLRHVYTHINVYVHMYIYTCIRTHARTTPNRILQHPSRQPHVPQGCVRRDDERPYVGGPNYIYIFI